MKSLKIGVIGTGTMGQNHVRNLSDEARFDLVGIYDSRTEQAERVAERYHTKVFGTVDELLDCVEAVVVAVPSSLHKEVGLKVAGYGCHALIEKPLALSTAETKELSDVFEERGLKLAVGHIERFNPVIQQMEKLLDNTRIFYIEAHRFGPFSSNGRITNTSVIEDLMIHDIDLVCHLMEPYRAVDVMGFGERVQTDSIDFSTCMLRFDGNAHAAIHASRVSQDKERFLNVHTVDSCIRADLLARTLTVARNTDLVLDGLHANAYKQSGVVEKVFVPSQEPLRAELVSFYESVAMDKPVAVGADAAMRAIEICEAVAKQANASVVKE